MTQLESVRTDIDDVIARALSDNRIVGTVVLIARDGELVYQHSAGFADRESRKEMRVNTLFSSGVRDKGHRLRGRDGAHRAR